MQRKYYMLALLATLILGTIATYLPPAKSVDPALVRIWIENPADGTKIYPPKTPGFFAFFDVLVMIESPLAWFGTEDGIIAFTLSVRVDPRALEVVSIDPVPDLDLDGMPDDFLGLYAMATGGSTVQAPEDKDTTTGDMWGYGNALVGTPPMPGAGGDPLHGDDVMPLASIKFKSRSDVIASPIDLIGAGVIKGIDVSLRIVDGNGVKYNIEPDDGYYIATTPNTMFFDSEPGTDYTDPTTPPNDWHELWPTYSDWWSLESWIDNDPAPDGVLDASDQIDMFNVDDPAEWPDFHVDWLNPSPVGNDGLKDMVVTVKPPDIPEFPLGVGLMMILALLIPTAYIWRLRKKVPKQ